MPDILGLTDTHAHLSYVAEREPADVLVRVAESYQRSGAMILDPGVEYDDFPGRVAAFGDLPFVRFAAGIWPDSDSLLDIQRRVQVLESAIKDARCAAVGECGLDYHWMHGSVDQQASLFRAQAELALHHGKPLIVHSREAHVDTLRLIRDLSDKIPVLIHCFGYDESAAREYIAAGCWVSFAGNLTFKNARALRDACMIVPAERLLLETDAPYMCPEPMRGRNSSPLDIERTYAMCAALRGSTIAEVAGIVAANARMLFGASIASSA
ncbi:MAG TPA: TatD family hydrolase [bacterium]|nr:TatD family hydrolase [bacterium]